LRFGAGFGCQRFEFTVLQNVDQLGIGILKITKVHAFGRAYAYAGRIRSLAYPVDAEGAFVNITIRM
jgi:hypothetical protein